MTGLKSADGSFMYLCAKKASTNDEYHSVDGGAEMREHRARGASWAENVDLSRGSLEREKSCLFRRVGGVQRKECVKQASVTSFDAMQPSGCRGVQAGRQAEAGCSCALRWHLRPPGRLRALARRGCKVPEAISMLWC
eukprot:scaffold10356_cov118-Isochrysis_galbana.AAC.15